MSIDKNIKACVLLKKNKLIFFCASKGQQPLFLRILPNLFNIPFLLPVNLEPCVTGDSPFIFFTRPFGIAHLLSG